MQEIDIKSYKIVCGAMSWVSDPNLVAAVSNAHISSFKIGDKDFKSSKALGVLATGAMDSNDLDKALIEVKSKTNKPFAVNLISMSPHYESLLKVCEKHSVPIIIIAAAVARREKIEQIKSTGAKVIGFATSLTIAKMLIANGIDGIILEGSEAGGHVGSISTSVLVQGILFELSNEVPIIVAGGIGSGKMIKHYLEMGASGVQLGTRFVCSHESPMHEKCKDFYIKKQAKDTAVVGPLDPAFSVIPVRVIRNKAVNDFHSKQLEAIKMISNNEIDITQGQLMIENFWSGSLRRGVIEGDLEYGSLMAGQSISFVNSKESVQEIVDKLVYEISGDGN